MQRITGNEICKHCGKPIWWDSIPGRGWRHRSVGGGGPYKCFETTYATPLVEVPNPPNKEKWHGETLTDHAPVGISDPFTAEKNLTRAVDFDKMKLEEVSEARAITKIPWF